MRIAINKRFWIPALLLCAAAFTSVAGGAQARADSAYSEGGTEVEITPAQVATGPQMSWLQCPCFRWVVQVQAAGGQIETREVLITSEALLKFHEERSLDFQQFAVRLYTVGALEALWKPAHVGIGFTGVTWGEDKDRGYSDLLRGGLYALVNLLLSSNQVRLDLRLGDQYESMRVNNGPLIHRNQLDEAAVLNWRSKGWSGQVIGHVGENASHTFDPNYMTAGASANIRRRLFGFSDLEAGLAFNLAYEHDGWRNFMGLVPDLLTGTLLMDLTLVEGDRP